MLLKHLTHIQIVYCKTATKKAYSSFMRIYSYLYIFLTVRPELLFSSSSNLIF